MIREYIKTILIFTSLLLLTSTCNKGKTNKTSIDLVRIDSVSFSAGEKLFGKFFEQIKITNDQEYLAFAERIKNQVFIFNSKGNLHGVIGESGKGPKGIVQIYGFGFNNSNQVYILDSGQWLLKVFDLKGNLIYSTPFFEEVTLQPSPFSISWYKGGFVVPIFEKKYIKKPEKSDLIALVNKNGIPIKTIGTQDPFTSKDNRTSFFSEMALDSVNDLAYSNLQSSPYYQIHDLRSGEKVGMGGKVTKNFNLVEEEIKANSTIQTKKSGLEETSVNRRIFLTNEYVIQQRQTLTKEWFETSQYNSKKNYLVFYSKETNEFLGEISVPFTPIGEHGSKLYLVEDFNPDNYKIGIFEIAEN